MEHFNMTGEEGAETFYGGYNSTPMKAKVLSDPKGVLGCHPSRWIYELTNNHFTVCDLFERARAQNAQFDSPYAWDHPHKLVINGNQSYSTISKHFLSAICLDCHFHFVFKMSWDEDLTQSLCHHSQAAWPPRENMFPWHHLAWASSASPGSIASDHCKYNPILAREYFVCTADPCTFQLALEISEPRMQSWAVKLLLDHEAIRQQLDLAKEQDPSRYEGATDEWAYQAPLNLNTYLKNQLESTPETARSISKRNKRFSVLFGPRCFSLFRELEFQEKEEVNDGIDEGSFTPRPASSPQGPSGTTELNTYRAYLEDVRAEVQCLIHKAGQATEKPTLFAPMLHGVLHCVEVKDVESNALVGTDRYKLLGVLPTQGRDIVINAFKRQWRLMPSARRELIDALLNIANDAQDELLIDYAVTESSVYESQPRHQAMDDDDVKVSQALKYFGLTSPNNYRVDSIIQAFRKKLVDDPAEAGAARNGLMVIASGLQDDYYQAALLMEADAKMSLDTAKHVIGLSHSSNVVSDAGPATRSKLQKCQGGEARKLYLDALDSIADHTGSLSLKQIALELTHESETNTGLSEVNSGASVNFSLPVGLDNIGNTCYLNSLLQYLFTVKPVRDILLKYDDLKLGLSEEAIASRRIGGNKMQLDRGEAVVADAFARELATLFESLQTSEKTATRPSQRLANAVLLSTHTLLNSEKSNDRESSPLPPPLPSRPSPETVVATGCGLGDVDMVLFEDQDTVPLDTVSLSSTKTLVEHDPDHPVPSCERVEEVHGANGSTVPSAEKQSNDDDDEVISDPAALDKKSSESSETDKSFSALDSKSSGADMMDLDNPETIDQKVLSALERQKRSSGTDQQDVEEVMGSIINRLQAAIRPTSIDPETGIQRESVMETFFVTTVNYTKKFHEDKYQNEVSWDRSITAFPAENGPCSLYDALGRNFDQQILEESKLSRHTTIKTLPPILHVLIQRTQSNGSKNGNPVIIPETLYADRFMDTDHSSPAFQRRVEDWVTAQRIAEIRADYGKLEASPAYLKSLEHYKAPKSAARTPPENQDDVPVEVETFDFDGPVEDDFLLVSPSKPTMELDETPVPKVTGIYETYIQVKQMMEDELATLESTLSAHHAELTDVPYRLHAVICHRGQLMSGHYWVWIRDFDEDVWRWYNDADVKENKNTEEVLQTLSKSGEPYFLCYVRDTDKENFVHVPKREQPPPPPEPEPMLETVPEVPEVVLETGATPAETPTPTVEEPAKPVTTEDETLVDIGSLEDPAVARAA